MTRRLMVLIAAAFAAVSCTDGKLPTAATPIAGPAPPAATPPLPTTVPGVLGVAMPIDASDLSNIAFGMTPFGYHGLTSDALAEEAAGHAREGHAGWHIEYRQGGVVRAVAAGTVLGVEPDAAGGSRTTVRIEHLVGAHHYRTVYTNLVNVREDVVVNAPVLAGQALGTAGTVSQFVGRIPIVYAMTHFQLDDLEFHREGPDPKAVSPEPFLTAGGKALFDRIWSTAAFPYELVEPFASNPRDLPFPASRTWTRAGGDGPAGIRFTRRSALDPTYEYFLLAESGTVIETGTVSLNATARPFPTIDLFSATATWLGIYDIVSGEMRLTLAAPGSARPAALNTGNVYRTSR